MESNEGVVRLGRMAAVDSLERNLDTEDAAYAQEMLDHANPAPAGEEMRIMAARDVTVYPNPPATPPPLPTSSPGKATSTLVKAAMVAALVGSGAGAGLAIPWMTSMLEPPPPPAAPVDTTTQITIE